MVSAVAAVFGVVPGYSALLGGMVSWVANVYFVCKVFVGGNKDSAQSPVAGWYFAEFAKIAMTAVLLAAVYVVVDEINALALIGGFFLAYVGASVVLATTDGMQSCKRRWVRGNNG